MALKSIYDVIKSPVVTEKATKMVSDQKKIVLEVHPDANKPMIKEALEKLFDVRVKTVNVHVIKGKRRTFKRQNTWGKLRKRAIVTLKDSESFDKLAMSGAGAVSPEQTTASGASESK